jgi:UDP-glucose 4-epimerase
MRTLITGGVGFIGSHLTGRLLSQDQEVVILDDFSGASEGNLRQFKESKHLSIFKGSSCCSFRGRENQQ